MIHAALAFAALSYLAFAYVRLRRYLHIFQQEEYDGRRFLTWLVATASFDKRLSAALAVLAAGAILTRVAWPETVLVLYAIAFLAVAWREPDPTKAAKKKLVLTNRARRIFYTAFAFAALFAGALVLGNVDLASTLLAFIAATQVLPACLVLANWILSPVESHIQNGFRQAAENRLREVGPKIVGITGSFGKTSVKHILGHVLQMTTSTLYTPGSVNTVMGISRIINERLEDNCRYFLVEMGAYGIGSIKRLCQFTPPDHGIITAIGEAHYERFKDLDTVARAKFELAEAVRSRNGRVIIHESALEQPYARAFVDADRSRFTIVGETNAADIQIKSVEQKRDGLHVALERGGEAYALFAPLFGLHHGHNMALAFAFAVEMGIAPERLVQAMRSTPQIGHRLELKSHPSGALYLDDAYNSNPHGFANALDLLDTLKAPSGRRILVTPGMAELGDRHDEAHAEIGRKAAHATDVALVVKPERIGAFITAFQAEATTAELQTYERFVDAQAWLSANLRPGDVVLIENDLPDLYERVFLT
jgi:UDP-N-acetylmuramoyl-tripeptide--D-alanyl-D-alanine ligase